MSIKEVFEIALAVIASLGGGGFLVFALSSWLGKVWASRILESEKQEYKKEIEKYKKELEVLSIRDKIKFSELHKLQTEAIRVLYRNLVELGNLTAEVVISDECESKELSISLESLNKKIDMIKTYFDRNEILFSERICKLVGNLINHSFMIYLDIGMRENDISERKIKKQRKKLQEMKDKIPNILFYLKEEFRDLMGV
ncbi:MAG: hypothetical protein PHO48_02715 [Candidatus Gracilibacteria bacterium]|nr:hypothetical protein [Candidatus Gracilibacteria bacterium]MDD5179096.1 hypothetical protein [Candidatus Gracilibacteria bacterium]